MSFELSAPQSSAEQTLLALGILVGILVALILLGYRARYRGLPGPLSRQKAALAGAKADASFATLRLDAETNWQSFKTRRRLRRLLDPESTVERPRPRDALGEVRRTLAEAIIPYVMALPRPARWLLSLAANVAVWGLLAVSTELILAFLRTEPRRTQSVTAWPGVAVEQSGAVLEMFVSLAFAIPGVQIVWSLLVAGSILLWSSLFPHWYVIALLLAAAGVAIALLDRRVDDEPDGPPVDLPTPQTVAWYSAALTVIVWLIMLLGIGFGRRFISNEAGRQLGLACLALGATAALAVVAYWTGTTARDIWRWYRAMGWERRSDAFRTLWTHQREHGGPVPKTTDAVKLAHWLDEHRPGWDATPRSRAAAWLLGVRIAGLAFAALIAPLLVAYVVIGLSNLPTVASAYLAAAPEVKLVIAAVVGVAIGLLGWQTQAAWSDIRAAAGEVWSHGQVRAVAIGRGLPVFGVVFAYIVAYGFLQSIVPAAAIAVVAGLIVRAVYLFAIRIKYRASLGSGGPTPAGRVVVQAAELEDDRGETHYYARVNGDTELLHPDREKLIDAIQDIGEELTTVGESSPTLPEWHARFAFRAGVADVSETRQKLRERVRKQLYHRLRRGDRLVAVDEIEQRLDQYPPEIREKRIDEEIYLGNIRHGGRYIELRNDPLT